MYTDKFVDMILNMLECKDGYTGRHSINVAEYSSRIAKELGFDENRLRTIRKAALLHDIGKLMISNDILCKPSRLSDEEYEMIRTHPDCGAELLKCAEIESDIIDGALYHHERYDGKGYPFGLSGEEIPLFGRIIAVADAFDAMTSDRIYRSHRDIEYAVNEIRAGKGKQFDPDIADIMLNMIGTV